MESSASSRSKKPAGLSKSLKKAEVSEISQLINYLPSYNSVVLVAGIYVFFLAFGYFQESVFRVGNKELGDTFKFPTFLVAVLCVGNVLTSFTLLLLQGIQLDSSLTQTSEPIADEKSSENSRQSEDCKTPSNQPSITKLFINWNQDVLREIALSAVTYVLSMVFTNYSLTRVNYPTQVLVKSAKSVPVILGGLVFFGKRYPIHDYLAVVAVTIALTIFNLGSSSGKSSKAHQTIFGYALLAGSLFCDSLTGPRQDRLLSRVKISSTHLMFLTNVFGSIFALISCLVVEGFTPFAFCARYPEVVPHILCFCLSASLGQVFIFGSLTAFGSLYLTLITTTRKFFTVLLSVLLFGHDISWLQWFCVATVFVSLTMQSVQSKLLKEKAKKKVKGE